MKDEDRAAILARRARMVGFALLGTTTVSASACACLTPISYDAGHEREDAGTGVGDAGREADANVDTDAPDDGGTP